MEFIIDYLLPALGTTVIGLAIIILLFLVVIAITVFARIKDYKEIKANLIELKNDVKSKFYGKSNKKRRIKIAGILTLFVLVIFTISAIYL